MKVLAILLASVCVISPDDEFNETRKYSGYSFYRPCTRYVQVFKCLSACKSMGFKVFRLNSRCRCTCHEMRTSTVVPFFQWRTNGTTISLPTTVMPGLYHIVGPLQSHTAQEDLLSAENTTDSGSVEIANATEDGEITTELASGNGTGGGNGTNSTG